MVFSRHTIYLDLIQKLPFIKPKMCVLYEKVNHVAILYACIFLNAKVWNLGACFIHVKEKVPFIILETNEKNLKLTENSWKFYWHCFRQNFFNKITKIWKYVYCLKIKHHKFWKLSVKKYLQNKDYSTIFYVTLISTYLIGFL